MNLHNSEQSRNTMKYLKSKGKHDAGIRTFEQ